MIAAEFAAVKPLLNISEDRISAARAALVDGETLAAVGARFGWTRQAVGDAVRVVWATFQDYQESQSAAVNAGITLPKGWERVVLVAPTHLITQFRRAIALESAQEKPAKASTTDK